MGGRVKPGHDNERLPRRRAFPRRRFLLVRGHLRRPDHVVQRRLIGHAIDRAFRVEEEALHLGAVNGREPRRPNTAIWSPVSSTARSRSRPLDRASAGVGVCAQAISSGLGARREAVEIGLARRAGQLDAPSGRSCRRRHRRTARRWWSRRPRPRASFSCAVEGHLLVDAAAAPGCFTSTMTRPSCLAAT